MLACILCHFSSVWLCAILWMVALQAPLFMGCSRQEYWSGLPCPSVGDLPDPRIKLASFMSPALAGGFFTTSTTWGAPLKNGPHQNSNNNKNLLKNAFGKSYSFLMPHCMHWKHYFKVLIYVSVQLLYMALNRKISKPKHNSTNCRGAVTTCLYSRFMCFLKWTLLWFLTSPEVLSHQMVSLLSSCDYFFPWILTMTKLYHWSRCWPLHTVILSDQYRKHMQT